MTGNERIFEKNMIENIKRMSPDFLKLEPANINTPNRSRTSKKAFTKL
jgi:hypothetical protein